MINSFKEKTRIPNFIHIIFAIQLFIFLFLVLENKQDIYLFIFLIGIILIWLSLIVSRLSIIVNLKEIKYGFHPFMLKKKIIKWSEVEKFEIIKISAISDFMGWGIRYSKKYGWGYITSASYAIQIRQKNGKGVVLSINNKEQLEQFISLNNLNKINEK